MIWYSDTVGGFCCSLGITCWECIEDVDTCSLGANMQGFRHQQYEGRTSDEFPEMGMKGAISLITPV